MAATITPAVSGSRSRWCLNTASFFVGALFGAVVTLLASLLLIQALLIVATPSQLRVAASALLGWAVLREVGLSVPLPYRSRQVPEWLREALPMSAVAATYGFMLGIGFLTHFTTSAHMAFVVLLPFLGSTETMLLATLFLAVGKTIVLMTTAFDSRVGSGIRHFHWSRAGDALRKTGSVAVTVAVASLLLSTTGG